jgi:hypothetical protein
LSLVINGIDELRKLSGRNIVDHRRVLHIDFVPQLSRRLLFHRWVFELYGLLCRLLPS